MANPLYDTAAVKRFVSALITDGPKGSKASLARRAGVRPPTITKWGKGETCPSPDFWEAIEAEYGLESGRLATVGGVGSFDTGRKSGSIEALAGSLVAELDALLTADTPVDDSYVTLLMKMTVSLREHIQESGLTVETARALRIINDFDADLDARTEASYMDAAQSGQTDAAGIDVSKTHQSKSQAERQE